MKILCHFMLCKWVHIADYLAGYNEFNQLITRGLWQCSRCGKVSKGRCGNKPLKVGEKYPEGEGGGKL